MIVIVGGGYIALEFAGIFHAFGSEVHVVFRQPKPLRGFDEEVRGFVMEQMAMQGIHFHPNETPARVEEVSGRGLVFTTDAGASIEVDQVMLATGRKPNTTNLGLEDVGVEMSKGGVIKVRLQISLWRRRGRGPTRCSRRSVSSAVDASASSASLTRARYGVGGSVEEILIGQGSRAPFSKNIYRNKNSTRAAVQETSRAAVADGSLTPAATGSAGAVGAAQVPSASAAVAAAPSRICWRVLMTKRTGARTKSCARISHGRTAFYASTPQRRELTCTTRRASS